MARVEELQGLASFDYTDPAMRGPAFHVALDRLRSQGWLAKGPYGFVVLDREAGEHFLRSRNASFPGAAIAELFQVQEGPLREEMRRNILHLNGADHSRLRSLLNPSLSPKAVQRHRPAMRELLGALFDRMVADACVGQRLSRELVETITKPYPAEVIAQVMGAPLSDAPQLNHWSQWIQRQFDAQSMIEQRDQIEAAVAEFYEYADALLAARRRQPGEDLISMLLAAEEQGDRLSEVECVNLVLNVLVGGVDTTQSQLAHALRLFAEHPEQWEMLAREPELAGQAVQETLRFEPVTPFSARIVEQEIVFRDVTFPPGTIVMVCAFTGNRDLDGEVSAESFDIAADRPRARNLTFGAGIHYCVGANLAQAELEEALSFLAPRMRSLQLDGEPEYGSITGIYGLSCLPVSFELASTA
ncbi:MAG: cytochrome P450 [Solirubrobacteraceae bacterium]